MLPNNYRDFWFPIHNIHSEDCHKMKQLGC
jgi:hypothetical protein